MKGKLVGDEVFGFVKPKIDVHTLGVSTISNLLKDCKYKSYIAPDEVNEALLNINKLNNYGLVKRWLQEKGITNLGFSYRLDPQEGCHYFMSLFSLLQQDNVFVQRKGWLRQIFFAGLPDTCELVSEKTNHSVLVFEGDETPLESLLKLGVPQERLPNTLLQDNEYDNVRWKFASELIASERYKTIIPQDHYGYASCGKDNDTFIDRLNYAKSKGSLPLIRAHVGPYNPNRLEALKEFQSWVKILASSKLLDVLSIGSSQLTQSKFGEDWEGLPNGGGVPINSEIEYQLIKEAASPMLVRTYSGTKDVPKLARIHERALNISWHALSLWWFCEIDGRGENSLLENLREHLETIKYIAFTGKPMEPNVPHHFAFRGADDLTYIISGFLAAKTAKKLGIQHLILQNMLNTPKYTWGVQDLAKGRVMMKLVRDLEDDSFHVSLQARAGLDYFSPDLEKAKVQLAAVTALMDDLEPDNINSPEIIHVVSYSEAVRLATPSVIKESIQITLSALHSYRTARSVGKIPNMKHDKDVQNRVDELFYEAKESIRLLENYIPNLYTPEGLYRVFDEGFFPVPYLMDYKQQFRNATNYTTAIKNGGIRVVDEEGNIINTIERYKKIISRNS
ncbi:Uncharacterised protein [Bacteroides pyogenes]|nr:Uncharacterised protein [Bacteroides pyogenes]